MGVAPPPPDPADEPVEPDDPESVARMICLRALTARARTRSELESTLRRRGIPDDAARIVLDRFVEVGLVNDEALAAEFAQTAHAVRGLSSRAVATKLRQRGVDQEVVDSAVAGIDPESERAAALALAQRKARTLGGLEPQAQARRLVSLLARRGYSPGLSYAVAREVLAGADTWHDVGADVD
jgi:regulatory protein